MECQTIKHGPLFTICNRLCRRTSMVHKPNGGAWFSASFALGKNLQQHYLDNLLNIQDGNCKGRNPEVKKNIG